MLRAAAAGLRRVASDAGRKRPGGTQPSITDKGDARRLPLSASLRTRLQRLGVRTPTEVQKQTLAPILEGRDVIAVARRGSGKTVAFLAPIFERIENDGPGTAEPSVVLEPTRDLAEQTYLVANRLRHRSTKVVLLYGGGGPQALEAQCASLHRGAHLVIGTPGRLREVFDLGLIRAERVRTLVVDEADDMLTQGLRHDVRAIIENRGGNSPRQTLLFAGAFPSWLLQEVVGLLQNPVKVDLLSGQPPFPLEVKHIACEVTGGATRRARLVAWVLEGRLEEQSSTDFKAERLTKIDQDGKSQAIDAGINGPVPRAIIFAATRAEVSLLSTHAMLRQRVIPLHAQMGQEERVEALELFASAIGYALVTTDMAVRGLDLPPVPLVIHSQVPSSFESYCHRLSHVSTAAGATVDSSSKAFGTGRRRARSDEKKSRRQRAESVMIFSARHSQQLRDFERELCSRFDYISPPNDDLLRSSAMACISRELRSATMQYDVEAFHEDAEQQLEIHGPRLLAAALVLLERRRRGEDWVSPLSGRARYTPLLFFDPYMEQLRSRQAVISAIERALRRAPAVEAGRKNCRDVKARVGRVELTRKGYVADVPHSDISKLLADSDLRERGISVTPIAHLPEILEERVEVASRRRSRAGRGPRRHSLRSEQRAQHRLDFLYPSGRRQVFGDWIPGGRRDAEEGSTADTSAPGIASMSSARAVFTPTSQ